MASLSPNTVSSLSFTLLGMVTFRSSSLFSSKLHFYTDLVLLHNTKKVQNYTKMTIGENFQNSQPQVKIHWFL